MFMVKVGDQYLCYLTEGIREAIQILIETRKVVGVSPKNIFVFAAPTRNSTKSLHGSKCLSTVIGSVADLERWELIKSMPLRYKLLYSK